MPARPPARPAPAAAGRPQPLRAGGSPATPVAEADLAPEDRDMPPAPPQPALRWVATNWRSRLLAAVLALALATALFWEAVQPKLALMNARAARGEAPVPMGLPTEGFRDAVRETHCHAQPQTPGCVGAPMPIQVLPARPSSAEAAR